MRDRFTAISEHKRTKSVSEKTGTPPENDREGNQEGSIGASAALV